MKQTVRMIVVYLRSFFVVRATFVFVVSGYVYHVDLFVVLRICYLFILMSCCFSLLHFFVFGSRSLEIRCMFLCVLYTVQNIISLLIIFYYHWFMFFILKDSFHIDVHFICIFELLHFSIVFFLFVCS